jgi:hypothetical protein
VRDELQLIVMSHHVQGITRPGIATRPFPASDLTTLVGMCGIGNRAYLQPQKSTFLLTEFNLKLVLELGS